MPLHIGIDIRHLRDFGIGTYIRNLVRALGDLDGENRYSLIAAEADPPELPPLPPNFSYAVYGKPDAETVGFSYALFLRGLGADLFHIPLNSVPLLMPRPYVVTVHDMSTLLYDNAPGFRNNLHLLRFRRGLLRAARVMTVSNATRRDVESVLGIPAERIRTIYNAPDPAFLEPAPPAIPCLDESGLRYPPRLQRIMDRYQINYPFLLYAGNIRPQKNIPRLVEAFAVVRGELKDHPLFHHLHLIIIGDEISHFPAVRHAVIKTRVEHEVRFLGFVPIETLRCLYQTAQAFVFPSLYEGFGLPPLEAMSCGAPVVASNVSALPEVIGDAAVIVNPENVFDIARGIRDILLDPDLRQRVVARGYEQSRRFSWQSTASQVLETYRQVAGR
ncbi:MAG: glycosyltransferase family 1 protein [Bryobacteraceae bacterium]|jgi:glycosyltransferase involved in cell wall biosynthesis